MELLVKTESLSLALESPSLGTITGILPFCSLGQSWVSLDQQHPWVDLLASVPGRARGSKLNKNATHIVKEDTARISTSSFLTLESLCG